MPALPDLRAKIKIDFSDLAGLGVQAKLVGETLQRELSGTRAASIDSSMRSIGTSVEEAGRRAQGAGTAFIKWGADGEAASLRISSATVKTRADFDDLERRTRTLGSTLETEFRRGATAVIKLSEDGSASLGHVSRSLIGTAAAGNQAGSSLSQIGFAIAGAAVPALIGLGSALLPVVALIGALVVAAGAAVIAITGFAAGIAAVASVIAISLGGIVALGAGIIALSAATQGWTGVTQTVPAAQQAVASATLTHQQAVLALQTAQATYNSTATHTAAQTLALQQAQQSVTNSTNALTKAQQDLTAAQNAANNPLATLKTSLGDMANTLGAQAAPMAGVFLGYLNLLVPSVQALGQQLLTWFGNRLPAIMTTVAESVVLVFGVIRQLGAVWGEVIDYFLAHKDVLLEIFSGLLQFGVGAIQGLVTNLLALSSWFLERLPKFQPVISQIFGGLGTAIQAIIQAFGRLVDWVLANWPAIIATIGSIWSNIAAGWNFVHPILDAFFEGWRRLAPLFDYIRANAEALRPALLVLGVVVGILAFALLGVVAAVVLVVAGLVWLMTKVSEAVVEWIAAGRDIGDAMGRLGRFIGDVFSAIGTFIHTAIVQYQQLATDVGTTFSNIGTILRGYQSTIGNVFSAVGSFFRTAVSEYQQAGRDIGAVFSGIGSAANGMANAVGGAFSGLGTKVHDGLSAIGSVFDKFGGLVNGALGGFGIHINPIGKFAAGGVVAAIPGGFSSFASGGVLPGYAPGQDTVPAWLSPGEGILTPQTTRNLGGEAAINALNRSQGLGGLGAGLGAVSATIGAIGGQCVEFLQRLLGLTFHGNANTWVGAPYAHTQTAAPGELAVFTGGPYGHLAMVTNPLDGYNFEVLDSNWVAPLTIGRHVMNKGMYNFNTFLQPGTPGLPGVLGNIAGALPLGQILQGLISPLAAAAHAAANAIPDGWARPLANALIDKIVANVSGRAGGGPVVPGHLYTVGERGPELFSPDVPGQIVPGAAGAAGASSRRVEELLQDAVNLLREINGGAPVNASTASYMFGT